jgi:hypothetical protein
LTFGGKLRFGNSFCEAGCQTAPHRELIQSISMDQAAAGKQQLGNFATSVEALLS